MHTQNPRAARAAFVAALHMPDLPWNQREAERRLREAKRQKAKGCDSLSHSPRKRRVVQ